MSYSKLKSQTAADRGKTTQIQNSGRSSVTPDLQEATNGPDSSPLLPPDELARLFVLHRMLKAVHRFGVLGTADIQRFPSGKIQQPLSLLRVKLAVHRNVQYLHPRRCARPIHHLISVITVYIQRPDQRRPLHRLLLQKLLQIYRELRRRIVRYHVHVKPLRTPYTRFYFLCFHIILLHLMSYFKIGFSIDSRPDILEILLSVPVSVHHDETMHRESPERLPVAVQLIQIKVHPHASP